MMLRSLTCYIIYGMFNPFTLKFEFCLEFEFKLTCFAIKCSIIKLSLCIHVCVCGVCVCVISVVMMNMVSLHNGHYVIHPMLRETMSDSLGSSTL